ncbi:MAG: trypsin-like peptidase domain-containing protein [Cyclobacteriaceae bacterium]
MKNIFIVGTISLFCGAFGSVLGWKYVIQPELENTQSATFASNHVPFENFDKTETPTFYPKTVNNIGENPDFVLAAEKSTSSVVFIQTLTEYEYRAGGWLNWFFEPRASDQVSSGSGVVISNDGFIVTNNHVVENADRIKVTLGKRTFAAELIGTDPSTDLAVIKIDGDNLNPVELGNSDNVNVGEWVLAVGNPFNLNSTVTGGIVSAKGRNINILKDKFPIESFIQTDAAINPGNSGGALVNMKGELIGINTAILSRTGSYAGYGFAVPVNIVRKVYGDLKKYGTVQKAFTGAEFVDVNSELAKKLSLKDLSGVIIANIQNDGAAKKAGLMKGDVIKAVNGREIDSKSYLEEYIGNLYPGDKLSISVQRDNKIIDKELVLTNREGTTSVIKKFIFTSDELRASFETVSKVERDLIGIDNGVKVIDYESIGFFAELGIPEGFIVTHLNNTAIQSPEELSEILLKIRGRVIISGIDRRGRKVYYPYYF